MLKCNFFHDGLWVPKSIDGHYSCIQKTIINQGNLVRLSTCRRTCRILLLVMGPSPDPAAAQSGPIHFLGLGLEILRRAQAQPRLGLKVLRRAQKFEFLLSKK